MTKKIRIILLNPKMAKRSGSRILGVGFVPALTKTSFLPFLLTAIFHAPSLRDTRFVSPLFLPSKRGIFGVYNDMSTTRQWMHRRSAVENPTTPLRISEFPKPSSPKPTRQSSQSDAELRRTCHYFLLPPLTGVE